MQNKLSRCIILIVCIVSLNASQSVYAFINNNSLRDTSDTIITPSPSVEHKQNFFNELGEDFYLQATSPFRMNTQDALYLSGFTIVTGVLIAVDQHLDDGIKPFKNKSSFVNATSPVVTEFGGAYGIYGCLAFGGYSIIAKDKKAQETSILLAEAIITSGVWSRVGKLLCGRERPSAAYTYSHERGGHWYGPLPQFQKGGSVTQYDGFPSGHMATAFAIATVFAEQYSDHKIVPVIAYSAALIIGLTRMIEHTHWASDVFAGSVLGYVCAQQVISYHRMNCSEDGMSTNDNGIHARWFLTYFQNSPMVNMVVTF
jgi:hypothetical protein